jgi:hypothetical protein
LIPHVPVDIRAFDTLLRQGVPSYHYWFCGRQKIKKEIFPGLIAKALKQAFVGGEVEEEILPDGPKFAGFLQEQIIQTPGAAGIRPLRIGGGILRPGRLKTQVQFPRNAKFPPQKADQEGVGPVGLFPPLPDTVAAGLHRLKGGKQLIPGQGAKAGKGGGLPVSRDEGGHNFGGKTAGPVGHVPPQQAADYYIPGVPGGLLAPGLPQNFRDRVPPRLFFLGWGIDRGEEQQAEG